MSEQPLLSSRCCYGFCPLCLGFADALYYHAVLQDLLPGIDLFGSFAESTCAALVIGSSIGLSGGWDAMVFPVMVSAVGIFVCLVCSFLATRYPKWKWH